MRGQAAAKEPEPRPPFPGDWVPEMTERGLSLFSVRLTLDYVDDALRVKSCIENQPSVRVPYEPARAINDGGESGRFTQIHSWNIAKTMPEAIETALANARWWINEERECGYPSPRRAR